MKKLALSLLLLAALNSCVLHSRYERPVPCSTPSHWRISADEANTIANVRFWHEFQDPVLDELICLALKNNEDLKAAIYRVKEYVAKLGIAESQLYPQISGTAAAARQEFSTIATALPPDTGRIYNEYETILNASYEVDIWGQIYSSTEVALAELLAQVEVRRTVVLTLVSSVASNYFLLRQYDKQHQISAETVRTRKESLKLAKTRFELGLTSELQVKQSESELQTALVDLKQYEISIAVAENLLSFLIGEPSHTIKRGHSLDTLRMPPDVPSGMPSQLLCQRPDILAAEQRLIAANAQIGVARAEMFPTLTLSANYGNESTAINTLFTNPAKTWQYGATLVQEIFTGGRITNDIRLAEAQKLEMLHVYESNILNGFKEVNDALSTHKISLELEKLEKERVQVETDYLKLATLRYENGQTDYLDVLDAERLLFDAQLEYAQIQGQSFTSIVELYAALGGGWVVNADCMALKANNQ